MYKMKRTYMLLTILLLLAGTLCAQEITVNVKNVTLRQALKSIEKASDYRFMFKSEIIVGVKGVTIHAHKATLEQVMRQCLKGTELNYERDGKLVYIKANTLVNHVAHSTGTGMMPNRPCIQGLVTDSHGDPLLGASVRIKGTTEGTTTDLDGMFVLAIPPVGSVALTVSYMGMQTKETKADIRTKELVIKLEEDTKKMGSVVVTGIFNKAKESYTGSVSTITRDQLKMFRGQNLLQTLKHADISLNFAVDNINGSNPNSLPEINLRGKSSLPMTLDEANEGVKSMVNTPLIILDGFEISLTQLMDYNDEEIESINIMKDAAATAIYGSRGANGVIVVNTRKPEAGRLKINAEAAFQLEVPDLGSYRMLNAADKLELERMAGLYESGYPQEQLKLTETYNKRLRNILSGVDTDWLSKPLHTGVGSTYRLRLEGGTQEFRWGTTLSYNQVTGAMKGSLRNTFNGSITLMYNHKNFAISNYTIVGINKSSESKYGSFSTYVNQQPYNAPYDANGNLVRYFPSFEGTENSVQNPLYDATLNVINKSGYKNISNNLAVDWTIVKGFIVRGQFSITSTDNTSDNFLPAEHSSFTNNSTYMSDDLFRRGSYTYGTGTENTMTGQLTLSYNCVFAEKHQLYLGFNNDLSSTTTSTYSFSAEGFSSADADRIYNARQYAKDGKPSGSSTISRRVGFTLNTNYSYDNRYYADLSYRIDGSSEYGENKRFSPFWSVGAGWNLHNEKWLKQSDIINNLRLKASYGVTGSQLAANGGAYTAYQYINTERYTDWLGAQLAALGNPDLTWQLTYMANGGLEFSLFNGRLRGSFEAYKKDTRNLLSSMELPHSVGVSSYQANIGEVRNKGWELSLGGYLLRNNHKRLNWMLSGQLTYNKNVISKLSEVIKEQTAEYMEKGADVSTLFFEGRPMSAIYAVRSHGIDPSTGDEVYIDRNGNLTKVWNAADKVFCGQSDPKYRGSLSSMLQWKGLTVNIGFNYYWGGKTTNSTLLNKVEVTKTTIKQQNVDERVFTSRWYTPGDIVPFRRLSETETRACTRFVTDDRVFELSSLNIQYRWSDGFIRKLHLTSLALGLNMSDIFYISTVKRERGTSYPYARNIQGNVHLFF